MKSIFTILLGITCLSAMPCEGRSHDRNSHPSKKAYVDPGDIRVTKDGIFVLQSGNWVPVHIISRDKKGVYVKKEWNRACRNSSCCYVYDWDRHTHCPRCGYPN